MPSPEIQNPPDTLLKGAFAPGWRTDSLVESVVILLVMNVLQRVVGFVRAVLFCRWLSPEQLGQWDLTFGFLMLAAPLSALAIPAAFGRYVEYYRQRGQLRAMFRRTAVACAVLTTIGVLVICLGRRWFSELIFGTPDKTQLVLLSAGTLWVVVVNHYFIELLTAMRRIRMLSVLQLANSLLFAALGIGLVLTWGPTAQSALAGYGGACVLTGLWVIWRMRGTWWTPSDPAASLSQRAFWAKVLPFVGWISVTSFLANLFVIADRYMIIHYSSLDAAGAQALVGQYRSAREVPLLLVSIALMLSTIIMPHLSYDWEEGRRDRVHLRLNFFVKLLGFALTAAAVAVLFARPLLFDWAFKGKYSDGLAVLPLTLTYSTWFGMVYVIQNYLLCAEKAHLGSLALLVGLATNIALNLVLLPRFGLPGAVVAATIANLVTLGLIAMFNGMLGFRMDAGAWLVLAAPMALVGGPWAAGGVLVLIAAMAFGSPWVLSTEEKRQIGQTLVAYWRRFSATRRRNG